MFKQPGSAQLPTMINLFPVILQVKFLFISGLEKPKSSQKLFAADAAKY
jgi:hypothetical protein